MRNHPATLLLAALLLTACMPFPGAAPPPPAATSTPLSPTRSPSPSPGPLTTPPASPRPSPSPAASPSPSPASALSALLRQADAAFIRRDFSTALRLYRGVAGSASAATPAERAFARFRVVVTDAIVGQEDDARAVLDQLRQQDAASPFLPLAALFWDTYGMTADPRAACFRVTAAIRENPQSVLGPLNRDRPAGQQLAAEDVCGVP